MQSWTREDALHVYNVEQWGEGYFDVDEEGYVLVRPCGTDDGPAVRLEEVLKQCHAEGLRSPVLVRFGGILRDRVRRLGKAFAQAIAEQEYQGSYTPVYPIKVNQQHRVVTELARARDGDGQDLGLEAGSKPELLAVLALSRPGSKIICNGYKDRQYIRLALLGERLGFHVYIVVEKPDELELILEEAAILGVTPRIGLRVRLVSMGKGRWQNSGGDKAKFGLSASQLTDAIERCREAGQLRALRLLHFHIGSQVANLQDIKTGVREAARYYQEIYELGAGLDTIDVGGGLGVDYEGTHSRSTYSMNYSLDDYAWHVVHELKERCSQAGIPEPDVVSESGRALTAHHAVLMAKVMDVEVIRYDEVDAPGEDHPEQSHRMWHWWQELQTGTEHLVELAHDVYDSWQDLQRRFLHDEVSLVHLAYAQKLYTNCLLKLRDTLDQTRKYQRLLKDELDERLADKLFVNFSVFQSVPDVWGIEQIFPILPIRGLDEPPSRRAVLEDITCDSDGTISLYVDGEGVESTLPLPRDTGSELAIFMVGAYQEILGDMHNLFGDTDSVDVSLSEKGEIQLSHPLSGDTVADVLQYVNFDADEVARSLVSHCEKADISDDERRMITRTMTEALAGCTYLEESSQINLLGSEIAARLVETV